MIAGSEAAAAPPAFPLADAGSAAENFFVAPAPRGDDSVSAGRCSSWAAPCASVQPALNKLSADPSTPVASVWVAPGYYSGASNGDLTFGGKRGIVRSLAGKEVTLLDGEWQRRLFVFSSFESPQSVVMGTFFFSRGEREERKKEREKAEERERGRGRERERERERKREREREKERKRER